MTVYLRLRCPQCRTRRTDPHFMALHVMECKRPLCHCLRVTHPHRPGSFPLCEQAMWSDLLKAAREGASEEDLLNIAAEIAWERPGRRSPAGADCPF